MAQEVKIKLSADGSQVRKEIKLIDQELKEIGGSSINRGKSGGQQKTSTKETSSVDKSTDTHGSADKVKQESRDKVNRQTLRELTLIRKELQKYNGTDGQGGFAHSSGGGNNTGSNNGNTPPTTPPSDNNGTGKELGKATVNLLTAAAALKAVTSIYSSLKSSAQSAQTGASLAFTTYGSTLAYTDYNQARKDASDLGTPYGYDSALVMNASEANMSSGAGFTTKENYESDMSALLRTSKAWGIDAGSLAGTSGFMSSIGVTESGNQKKFADLLAESIVEAEMTGREKEQLQVLEQIADNLAGRNTTVTGDQLGNSLGMYNALINQNENLKGTRGASLVTTMQDLAAGGNSSLDVLAGFGTTYTGLSGQLELRKLAEENPEQYWAQVHEGVQKYGLGDDYFKKLLYDNTGSISQAEEIMSALPDMAMGTYNVDDTSAGEQRTEDIIENYNNDKISTEERHDVEKQEKSDDRGNWWNNITKPFENFYNGLPDWAQQGVDIGEGAVKIGAGIFGTKAIGKLFTGGASGSAAGGGLSSALSSAGTSITEGLSSFGTTLKTGMASVAEDIGAAVTAFDTSAIGTGIMNFAAAGGMDLLSMAAPFAPALPDAMRTWGAMAEDDKEWSGLSDTEKERREFTGESLSNSGLFTGWGQVGSKAGRDGVEYLEDLQVNIQSGTNDWVKDWVNTYWKEFDGQLESAYDNKMESILKELGIDIGQDSWKSVEDVEKSLSSMSEEDKKKILNANATKYNKGTTFESVSFAAGSENDLTYDLQKALVDEYNNGEDTKYYQYRMKDVLESHGINMDNLTNSEVEDYLKDALGSSYQRKDAHWWYYGDSDDSKFSKNGSIQFNDRFKTDSFDKLLGNLASSWTDEPATQENTEAVSGLTTEISEMREWLENNGFSGTAVWTDDAVKDKYNEEHQLPLPSSNSKTTGSLFTRWNNWFSHATGNDYVPYDNYTALLHRGEMVLTASEANDYRQGKVGSSGNAGNTGFDININLNGGVTGMTAENQSKIVEAIIAQINSSGLQQMISNGFVRVQNY